MSRKDTSTTLSRWGGRSIASLIGLVERTSKKVYDRPDLPARLAENHPFILACWHGQFMMLSTLNRGVGLDIAAMVARHGDADLIGEAMRRFDVELVRGAGAGHRRRDRGGAHALRGCMRALNDGRTVVMTADVPPGPARHAGQGIIQLARLSGRPILPVAVASSRFKSLRTWSRLTINLPFSTLGYAAGDPIFVPRDASPETLEALRIELEDSLNDATNRAYRLAGQDAMRITPNHARPAGAPVPPPSRVLRLYRGAAQSMRFAVPQVLRHRERRGKEDPARRGERLGRPALPRPHGPLAWFHAASVGELNAISPILSGLRRRRPDVALLVTTGTTTSARIAAERLSEIALHQFVPVDVPAYARSFLDHWQPDLAVLTESEIWPNLIFETHARGTPIALVNARISNRSFRRWKSNLKSAEPLFGRLDAVLAQDPMMAHRFRELGARHVILSGNLKYDAPPPPVDAAALGALRASIGARPVWLAASTHDPEETIVADAHRILSRTHADLLSIIVPRHPARGLAIAEDLMMKGLRVAMRSEGALPTPATDVYIADTLGELGTFYALSDVAFVGGSLSERGGQNPIEAVRLDCAVLTGPNVRNFEEAYGDLERAQAVEKVTDAASIAGTVATLLSDHEARCAMAARAKAAVAQRSGALDVTLDELIALMALPAPAQSGMRPDTSEMELERAS